MIVYGTGINCDIDFPLNLPLTGKSKYQISLSGQVPEDIRNRITCGFPFYFAHGRNVYLYSDRVFDSSDLKQPWCYEVKDVVRFYWLGGRRTIYYELDEFGSTALLNFWFIHLLLPLYYTLEDMYDFLHAGAVEVQGKPILFIAPSMGGKSTLTNYFIRQGHTLVSDDKVATYIENKRFMLVGSHPYHRPYRKFEDLGQRVDKFLATPKPIHVFYALEKAKANADVLIDEITGHEKFVTLMPNYLYTFPYLQPKRLHYLSSMLNETRMFRITLPWKKDLLTTVYNEISRHCETIE